MSSHVYKINKYKEASMPTLQLFISVVLMALTLSIHANEPISFKVKKGPPSFVITLASNPTTGFQWSVVSYDKDLLTLSSSTYQGPDSEMIGAGGHMLYTFSLNKGKNYPGTTDLMFQYARPWEKVTPGAIQKVTVNFR
jgi:inhibitor of cysteine peptidase